MARTKVSLGAELQGDFGFERPEPDASTRLMAWEPEAWPVSADWKPVISEFLVSPAAHQLSEFVAGRLAQGATIFPPEPFRALQLTSLAAARVVILGQDPYHGAGQAHGLAFSVPPGVKTPPSLRNIGKELSRDLGSDQPRLLTGSLEHWASQGVLLLNTCLTVEEGSPGSHAGQGWEALTDALIGAVGNKPEPVVFMLWGAFAQSKRPLIAPEHLVLTANHPSPLSAMRGPSPFMGCGHFSLANVWLEKHGQKVIAW